MTGRDATRIATLLNEQIINTRLVAEVSVVINSPARRTWVVTLRDHNEQDATVGYSGQASRVYRRVRGKMRRTRLHIR